MHLPHGKISIMQTFRDFFLGLSKEQRRRFASRIGRSPAWLLLVAYGHKRVSVETALAIEAASGGLVKAETLVPGIYNLIESVGFQRGVANEPRERQGMTTGGTDESRRDQMGMATKGDADA